MVILKLGSCKNSFERGKYFFSFSAPPNPLRLEMELGLCFLIFPNFFAILLGILKLGTIKNGFERENFLISFTACRDPLRLENEAWLIFFIFFILLLFFGNSRARVR